ncbi:MAG: deoxyribonuclease IV [Bacilli bacterium]|nr:deoxyribonuclease IV [Bacilli bacterium]
MIKIGSHVSNSGDLMLYNSLQEALSYKANCFMVYLGPPQSTQRKPFDLLHSDLLQKGLKENNIKAEDVIIHAPYIVNLAQPDIEKRQFGIDFITSELKMTYLIGAKYMVLHPGAHMKEGVDRGLELISDSLKKILENTSGDDSVIALETMAGKGSECCYEFSQIRKLIDLVGEPLNKRLGVCFDTCHVHDAGYDIINNYDEVMNEFDKIIGFDKIKVFHINDSKNERGSHKDRHENIGFGCIGFEPLMKFINDPRFINIPKILETPYVKNGDDSYPPYKYEIEMIRRGIFNNNLINDVINNK